MKALFKQITYMNTPQILKLLKEKIKDDDYFENESKRRICHLLVRDIEDEKRDKILKECAE